MAGVPFNPLSKPTVEQPAVSALDPQGIQKLRAMKAQAPNAGDMSDAQFALAMHQNHYSDMPLVDFLNKVGMDRGDVLYELRAPGDPYGDYLRSALASPGAGEADDAAAARHGGALTERRAGDLEGSGRAYLQGGALGFGDELVAAGAAALDPLVHGDRGKDFGERYDAYLGRERGLTENFREDNPVAAYGMEFAGAVPTSVGVGAAAMPVAGTTKFGQLVGTGLTSASEGGVYGFGAGEGDVEDRLHSGMVGAGLGAVTGAVTPAVAAFMGRLGRAKATKLATQAAVEAAPRAKAIKQVAKQGYRAAENTGAVVSENATSLLGQDVRQLLADEGLILPRSGALVDGFPKVKGALNTLEEYAGGQMTMKQAQTLQKTFRKAANSTDPDEARIGAMMLEGLDDFFDTLPQSGFLAGDGSKAVSAWQTAKSDYARFKRTAAIEDAIERAELNRGGFQEGFRKEMRNILTKPKKQRGFSAAELEAMRAFVNGGGSVDDLLQVLSGGGTLPAAFAGSAVGGPVGGAIAGGAKALGSLMAKGAANKSARKSAAQLRAEVALPNGLRVPVIPDRNETIARLLMRSSGSSAANVGVDDRQRQQMARMLIAGGR